jgi:hypothetical protein
MAKRCHFKASSGLTNRFDPTRRYVTLPPVENGYGYTNMQFNSADKDVIAQIKVYVKGSSQVYYQLPMITGLVEVSLLTSIVLSNEYGSISVEVYAPNIDLDQRDVEFTVDIVPLPAPQNGANMTFKVLQYNGEESISTRTHLSLPYNFPTTDMTVYSMGPLANPRICLSFSTDNDESESIFPMVQYADSQSLYPYTYSCHFEEPVNLTRVEKIFFRVDETSDSKLFVIAQSLADLDFS